MKYRRSVATTVFIGSAFLCFAGTANATPCTVPTSLSVGVLPAGCGATLTNGPITFTGVTGFSNTVHNFEIDSLLLSNVDIGANTATLVMQGFDQVLGGTTTAFNYSLPSIAFQTTPTGFPPDTGSNPFIVEHFIAQFPGGTFKLNFGEAFRPPQQSTVTSSSSTTSPGFVTVSSFFDLFTELSLNGGFSGGSWTVADNDFLPGTNFYGTGSILQVGNVTPEPGSLLLLGTGVAGLVRRRFRRR